MESIKLQAIGTILQMVRFETELPEEELYRVAREREPQFRALTGLLQKYYLKLGPREYGGVYIWDSAESLQAYRDSDLRIPSRRLIK